MHKLAEIPIKKYTDHQARWFTFKIWVHSTFHSLYILLFFFSRASMFMLSLQELRKIGEKKWSAKEEYFFVIDRKRSTHVKLATMVKRVLIKIERLDQKFYSFQLNRLRQTDLDIS